LEIIAASSGSVERCGQFTPGRRVSSLWITAQIKCAFGERNGFMAQRKPGDDYLFG
jgi:hypothetical protein